MIIAFTKDWDDVPTCTTHILREMAKTMPVLWVSSIGTRKPSAASGKDLGRIVGRVLAGLKRAEWKENQLRVLKPILIPKAESRMTKWINRKVFAWYVRRETRVVASGRWQVARAQRGTSTQAPCSKHHAPCLLEYWCFVPNAVELLPGIKSKVESRKLKWGDSEQKQVKQAKVVYYCADDWGQFHNLDGAWMNAREQDLVARADAVFVTSRFLQEKILTTLATCHLPPATLHYMSHGVEYARFAEALDKTQSLPGEVASLPKPVVGFYGNLHPWVDFEMLETLACARPEWSFVLIGEKYADVSALEALPNVHLLGRREHACLHTYCRAFDVAMIPYDMRNPRMESVNPVKTKELLAAGVPVVASDVPELRNYAEDVLTCTGAEAWLKALDQQVVRTDHAEISERVRDQSWAHKVKMIRAIIEG